MLVKYADDWWSHLGPGSWNVSPRTDMQVVPVSEVQDLLDVLMMERHTVSLHLRRGGPFQQFQIIAKARVWKEQAVTSFS